MNGYFSHPHHDDPVECRLPLKSKEKLGISAPKPVDLPKDLQFGSEAKANEDLAPLIKVFQKHPHIRDAVITALRDEGYRP